MLKHSLRPLRFFLVRGDKLPGGRHIALHLGNQRADRIESLNVP